TPVSITGTISTDGTSIIITPDLPLIENSDYEIEVYRLEDMFGNVQVSRTIRTFQTDKLNMWSGNGLVNDWIDSNNWLDGNLVVGKSVIIPVNASAFPIIDDESVDVNNLIVEAGAVVNLTGSGILNINGIFNLQSSSTVNASFIKTGGTLNVEDANVQIDQVVSDPSVTYFFSSPVSGATPNSIGTTQVVYQFNNSTGLYSVVNGSSPFTFGRGYATRSTQPLVFSGTVNQGNLSYPVYRSTAGFGWNLVGNPYPASIDWTLFKDNNINLEDAFWVWNQDGGNYGVYNSGIVTNGLTGPVIPSNQAFLVKVLLEQTEGSVAFNTESLVQNTHSYLKSASTITPHIKLAGVNGAFRDEVAFAVTSSASHGIDRLDTEKYFSITSGLFQLFSKVGSMSTVISSYPSEDLIEIPLGFKANVAGSFAIEMTNNDLPDYKVLLVDVLEDARIDFTDGGRYDFCVTKAGVDTTRFKVELIKQSATLTNDIEYEQVDIYVNDGTLFVRVFSGNSVSDYEILDLNGRLLRRGLLVDSEFNRIEGLEKGFYILSIRKENQSVSNHKIAVF
ncbi:MAG: T9SS type A sorting domain-containing protein, partial [Bacteroidales bacterium]|nr:T9SS type A sorting domain-containing protein [Bacteroidales bacterium]